MRRIVTVFASLALLFTISFGLLPTPETKAYGFLWHHANAYPWVQVGQAAGTPPNPQFTSIGITAGRDGLHYFRLLLKRCNGIQEFIMDKEEPVYLVNGQQFFYQFEWSVPQYTCAGSVASVIRVGNTWGSNSDIGPKFATFNTYH